MHEILVNRLGGLSLPRKSVVRLTDRPEMTLEVKQQCNNNNNKLMLLGVPIFKDIKVYLVYVCVCCICV